MYRMVNALEAYEVIEKQAKNTVDKWKMDGSGMTASEIMTTTTGAGGKMVTTIDKKKSETIDYALTLLEVDKSKTYGQDLDDVKKG